MNRDISPEAKERISKLLEIAKRFPSLANTYRGGPAPGLQHDQWNPYEFEQWTGSAQAGNQARWAARFLLYLWNPQYEWRCGWFDLHSALNVWDSEHRTAFLTWANDPWWP